MPNLSLHDALPIFDTLMTGFIEKHRVPGAALAVLNEGRLVYARGYGYADTGTREPVSPTSLFRIASISKPITAVAIMKLVEDGKLTLDDKVFDILEFDPFVEREDDDIDKRQREITIRQLLQHRGGWDRNTSFDPMFRALPIAKALGREPPATAAMVIRYMSGKPLDFAPGERYSYSNYGYNLLGRIIEKVTGQNYEAHVKDAVLAPLGIQSMRIGRTMPAGRVENEVRYYHPTHGTSIFAPNTGAQVPHPYGAWHLEAMDSHGGWIASATDLAKFAAAFAKPENNPVLSAESIGALFAPPAGEEGKRAYACGWSVRPAGGSQNRWHSGSLPGTATLLVLRHDQKSWLVLFNSRAGPEDAHLTGEIDPLLHRAANAVVEWPLENLFDD